MFSFKKTGTIGDFQKFILNIYGLLDDRLYSVWDLLVHNQRFAMRALKGIRKGNLKKLKINLLISFSFLMAVANRLHIDIEDELWKRFPRKCSYCGNAPCVCKKIKPRSRVKLKIDNKFKPKTLAEFQKMFNDIYPLVGRTLAEAGVHFAEEVGEVSEAIHNFLGEHRQKLFDDIKLEIADYTSCVFGIANSAKINISYELAKIYRENCHVCHKAPCVCNFSRVAHIET